MFEPIVRHFRILGALIMREMATRFGREGLGFAWVVGLMINQFYLAAQGVFSVWTIVAAAFAVAIVFQLLRPMPSYAWDDEAADSAAQPAMGN